MSRPRHPHRFHVERQQAQEFRRWRDARGNPPAADSPVVRAHLAPITTTELSLEDLKREAQLLLHEAAKPTFAQLRQRYPGGWINAPYVGCERLERRAVRLINGVPVLTEVVELRVELR